MQSFIRLWSVRHTEKKDSIVRANSIALIVVQSFIRLYSVGHTQKKDSIPRES